MANSVAAGVTPSIVSAGPEVLDQWSSDNARLGDVVNALYELRHRSARSGNRNAVMTLVVVATTDAEADLAAATMHALHINHPARIVLVKPRPQQDAPLEATATIFTGSTGGQPVTYEEVDLVVSGAATDHLDTIVEPFTLADLPLVVWYPGTLPRPTEPLLVGSTATLVDSRETTANQTFTELRDLARRRTVVDLSWTRLQPGRELLAGLFEAPVYRPFVQGVTAVRVEGKPGPRHLLGGWLASQLSLPYDRVTLVDARHIKVTVSAVVGNETGTFEVGRLPDRRVVRSSAGISSGASNQQVLPLPDGSLAWSLGQALTHLDGDPVWERALSAAASMSRRK